METQMKREVDDILSLMPPCQSRPGEEQPITLDFADEGETVLRWPIFPNTNRGRLAYFAYLLSAFGMNHNIARKIMTTNDLLCFDEETMKMTVANEKQKAVAALLMSPWANEFEEDTVCAVVHSTKIRMEVNGVSSGTDFYIIVTAGELHGAEHDMEELGYDRPQEAERDAMSFWAIPLPDAHAPLMTILRKADEESDASLRYHEMVLDDIFLRVEKDGSMLTIGPWTVPYRSWRLPITISKP